jgi:hypothetical protein
MNGQGDDIVNTYRAVSDLVVVMRLSFAGTGALSSSLFGT